MSTLTQTGEVTVTIEIGGEEISFSSGRLAKQADGAVVVRSGETMVLATAVGRTEAREGADFFPLTVDIEEKMYAAGKIPGGFFKREGKASEKATLNARMVDRPIRPLWPKGFQNEVQVIATVLSIDGVHAHDILAINGASAALVVSSLPFLGPIGAVRIGRFGDELVVNPSMPDMAESSLDLIVCGTADAITMVEAGAQGRPGGRPDRGARARAPRDPPPLRAAARAARAGRQGEVVRPGGHRRARLALRRPVRRRARRARVSPASRSPRPSADRGRAAAPSPATPARTRWCAARRCSSPSRMIGEARRLKALVDPVREQFAGALRELSDAEQDSKELKSAKRAARQRAHRDRAAPAVPLGHRGRPRPARPELRAQGGRRGLQADRPPEDRGRQAPARRPRGRGDPADHVRGRRSPRARTARRSSPAARRRR